ncbi:hypothetical protein CPC08DRAFT_767498 [Agrocybe pediades]|nr:hypothetical protein CPC08DRAFT_767498 [Agrocybe pediades]
MGWQSPLKRLNAAVARAPNLSPLPGIAEDDSDVDTDMVGQLGDREFELAFERRGPIANDTGAHEEGRDVIVHIPRFSNFNSQIDAYREFVVTAANFGSFGLEDGEDIQMQGLVDTASCSVPGPVQTTNQAEEVWLAEEVEEKEVEEEEAVVKDAYMPETFPRKTYKSRSFAAEPPPSALSNPAPVPNSSESLHSRSPFSGPRPLSNGAASTAGDSTFANANTNPATPTTTTATSNATPLFLENPTGTPTAPRALGQFKKERGELRWRVLIPLDPPWTESYRNVRNRRWDSRGDSERFSRPPALSYSASSPVAGLVKRSGWRL